ncbi:perforin-like protein 4 [Plasmodium brasilianum]|uniref:Perforin-like protein 4 n=1 Tax=Plasmodium brasilianum TaxID=5824 RepID=A0ACB9YF68_PLABR|nr:perforin-like protein 4 [Plasmodium brasilianum]
MENRSAAKRSKKVLCVCLFTACFLLSYTKCNVKTNESNDSNDEIFSKYIGKGYDILFGYPLPNNELIEDPGFKEIIINTSNCIDVINENVCQKGEYFNFIDNINDVTNLAMDNINVDQLDRNIKPFSASMPYSSYFVNLEMEKKKYLVVQNSCVHTYATYNLRNFTNNINKNFLVDIEKLPILSKKKNEKKCPKLLYLGDPNSEYCSKYIKPWMKFFKKYGTHLVIAAHFGAKSFNTLEITLQKLEQIKIYNYKYPLRDVPYLNVFSFSPLLRDILEEANDSNNNNNKKKKNNNNKKNKNKKKKYNKNNNTNSTNSDREQTPVRGDLEKDIVSMKMGQNNSSNQISSLDIRGGTTMDERWNDLTYEIWKNSVYSNIIPIYLDLISLNSFMRIEKKESYKTALLYYNNLYGIDKENFYLSKNITDVLSDGEQITGSAKGSLTLSCPVGYIKSTGFILIINKSEKLKSLNSQGKRIKIQPCDNKGEYDISCAYRTNSIDVVTFGWMYCVKHSFLRFETIYMDSDGRDDSDDDDKNNGSIGGNTDGSNNDSSYGGKTPSRENSLKIICSEGNTLAFGFKMKLSKKENLEKIKVKPCTAGQNNCTINQTKNDSDYLLWGFCIPLSFHSISLLQLTYIHDANITTNVMGACSNNYINEFDNIFLGFSFSFDYELEEVNVSPCKMNYKFCTSKLDKKKKIPKNGKKHYAGMLLLCRYGGAAEKKFTHR